jgi:hypothetical protein
LKLLFIIRTTNPLASFAFRLFLLFSITALVSFPVFPENSNFFPPEEALESPELHLDISGWEQLHASWSGSRFPLRPGWQKVLIGTPMTPDSTGGDYFIGDDSDRSFVIPVEGPPFEFRAPTEAHIYQLGYRGADGTLIPSGSPEIIQAQLSLSALPPALPTDRIIACQEGPDEELLCGSGDGFVLRWLNGSWISLEISGSLPLTPIPGPRGTLETVFSPLKRFEETSTGAWTATEDHFSGRPTLPFRRYGYEPSGLAYWIDSSGRFWAGDSDRFFFLDDPLLVGPDYNCHQFRDLLFSGGSGLAQCEERPEQFTARTEEGDYQWRLLPHSEEGEGGPLSPYREAIFGPERQISILDSHGQLHIYEMGGWRSIPLPAVGGPVSTIHRAQEDRRILAGLGTTIVEIDSLGQTHQTTALPLSSPIIHIGEQYIVSRRGEIFGLEQNELLWSPPFQNWQDSITLNGSVIGYWGKDENDNTHLRTAHPALSPFRDSLLSEEASLLSPLAVDSTGALWNQRETQDGSAISLYREAEFFEQDFYCPSQSALRGCANSTEEEISSCEPTTLHLTWPRSPDPVEAVSSSLGSLLEREVYLPCAPSKIISLDSELTTGRAVAVDVEGRAWLHAEEGSWIPVPLPEQLLITGALLGSGPEYLLSGEGGLLHCRHLQCSAEFSFNWPILRLFKDNNRFMALGVNSITEGPSITEMETWPILRHAPYPPGADIANPLHLVEEGGLYWLMTEDGTLWSGNRSGFTAWTQTNAPIGLLLNEEAGGPPYCVDAVAIYRLRHP